jgi:hypothetical protein
MSNPTLLRTESTNSPSSAPKSGGPSSQNSGHPEQPYQTKKGCLIMIAVFGGLIALAVGAMLVTGMLTDK